MADVEFVFRPIERWPKEQLLGWGYRKSRWSFKAGWEDTMRLLRREVGYIYRRRSAPAVIQLALGEGDIRRDGLPRASSSPEHPGVVVAFESVHGPLLYATDEFELWQHNVRAIALGLEALRKVDRYGITSRGEQYAGWKQLAAGDVPDGDPGKGGRLVAEHGSLSSALHATHPDHGGDAQDFRDVMAYKTAGAA